MRPKHVPQRTCVACREVLPKRGLVRLVRTPEGVVIDPTGKKTGRGAYLHDKRSCWEKALKSDLLERALKTELTTEERERLRAHGNTMPDES
jgi:predicted RNA-binding protein YlxR (DUF448 family)